MQSNFSNVGFNRNLLKKTQFNKKCISFSTFKTNRSVPNIYQTLPFSACEQFTLPAYLVRSNKALWSQFFSFFWSRFLFFSYFVFACAFFMLNLVKHKEKDPKGKQIFKLLTGLFLFSMHRPTQVMGSEISPPQQRMQVRT